MNVYFIGGLAADERVFRHIRLPQSYKARFLNWVTPQRNESLVSYAHRMAEQIDTGSPYSIVGVSFGGMLATEISRLYPSSKTILIASVPDANHLPRYFRWMQKAGLPRYFPISMIKATVMLNRLFTAESPEDKEIIRSMVRAADDNFIRWALTAALEWEGCADGLNCIHIHGTRDIVFPIRYTRPTHQIRNGGHLMVMERADEINRILHEILEESTKGEVRSSK